MCWRAECDGELLISRCDGELGVIESYCGFGVIELQLLRVWFGGEPLRAGCDEELQRDGFTGELLRVG